jgi:hypothetical protein
MVTLIEQLKRKIAAEDFSASLARRILNLGFKCPALFDNIAAKQSVRFSAAFDIVSISYAKEK